MVNKYLWKEGAREERDLQRQINLPVFDPYQVTPQTGKVFLDRLSPDAGLTFFRWSTEGQRDQDSRCSSEARAAAWGESEPGSNLAVRLPSHCYIEDPGVCKRTLGIVLHPPACLGLHKVWLAGGAQTPGAWHKAGPPVPLQPWDPIPCTESPGSWINSPDSQPIRCVIWAWSLSIQSRKWSHVVFKPL